MTPEKWDDVKSNIMDKFDILEESKAPYKLKIGFDEYQTVGEKDIIIFESPLGKTKLEYITKPVILDKKEHYSKRQGTAAKTEYILSDSEYSHKLDVYLEKDEIWEKIDNFQF